MNDKALASMEVEALRRHEMICDYAGHEFRSVGGGLEICTVCQLEHWELSRNEKVQALVDEGLADDLEDARAQLEDMGEL